LIQLLDYENNRENIFSQLNLKKTPVDNSSFSKLVSDKNDSNVIYQDEAVSFRAKKEISKNSLRKEELKNQYDGSKRASKTNDFLSNKMVQQAFDKNEIQKEISRAFKEKTLKVFKNLRSNT
jgi:hypothetical protein